MCDWSVGQANVEHLSLTIDDDRHVTRELQQNSNNGQSSLPDTILKLGAIDPEGRGLALIEPFGRRWSMRRAHNQECVP